PPALLPWLKFCTGAVLSALLYTLVHLGSGGGWGWGGGGGSGSGGGKGDGKGSGTGELKMPGDPSKKGTTGEPKTSAPSREILTVELLGGNRYPGDGKYYLVGGKEPAITLAAFDEILKNRGEKIELHIRYSADSVGRQH